MKSKLREILSIQSESYNQFRMFAYIIRQLKEINCSYYTYNGCIYVCKGKTETYPCIVAHMDTVHEIVEDLTVVEIAGNLTGFNAVTMEQAGIGGDDKVGVFIALQCLLKFDNIKVVFFRDEETGCEGSYDSDDKFFADCGFILQCDRRGNSDFITNAGGTKLSNKNFQSDIKPLIKKYGYSFQSGLMTDVMALKESGINCSMANISCGYYNAHSKNEYVSVNDVFACLSMVVEIIEKFGNVYYEHKYEKVKHSGKYYSVKNWSNYAPSIKKQDSAFYWEDGYRYIAKRLDDLCECCDEIAPLTYVSEYNMDMCDKCIKSYVKVYDA